MPACIQCKYYLNNGVAHCVSPRVHRAVELLVGYKENMPPVHEMQLHFIRFTEAFCGIEGAWFEPRDDDD